MAAALRQGDFAVLVHYLGFEEQSTVELIGSMNDELCASPRAQLPAIVGIAPRGACVA